MMLAVKVLTKYEKRSMYNLMPISIGALAKKWQFTKKLSKISKCVVVESELYIMKLLLWGQNILFAERADIDYVMSKEGAWSQPNNQAEYSIRGLNIDHTSKWKNLIFHYKIDLRISLFCSGIYCPFYRESKE